MRRSTDCAPASDHGDDAGVSHALPGQAQDQGVKLGALELPMGIDRRRPGELALVQAASGQPDADAVVHQRRRCGSSQELAKECPALRERALQAHQQFAALDLQINLGQGLLASRLSLLGRQRCWNEWDSRHPQRHECGRYRCLPLSLFTDPAVHHVRVQAVRQGHAAYAGARLGAAVQHLCLESLAVLTPPWAVLIQRIFHRLHDPPSWGRCPLQAVHSRWDRQLHTFLWLACVSSTGPTHRRVTSIDMSFVAPFLRGRDSGAARRQVNQNPAAEPWGASRQQPRSTFRHAAVPEFPEGAQEH